LATYTKYPVQLDTSNELPLAVDNVTPVKAEVVNRLRDAIMAIEAELGIDPSRECGSVRARLDEMETNGGGGAIEIFDNGVSIIPSAIGIDFVGNVSVTIPQPLRAKVEVIGGQATQIQETISVTSNGQTSFTLAQEPIQNAGVMMFLNGFKQARGIDFTSAGTAVTYTGSVSLQTTDVVEFWYLVDLGVITSAVSKMRVYRGTSDLAGAAVTVNQTVTWNATSSLVTSQNATLAGSDTQLTPSVAGHFLCSGQLSLSPTVDAVSGITVEIVHNGSTVVHTVSDYGAIWGVGLTRSLSFSFPIDLSSGDTLEVRWKHSGTAPSTTELLIGDSLSWFAISTL
jgi:hypothetical protein